MPISSSSRTRRNSGPVLRSLSPSGRFYSPISSSSSSSAFASSSSSSFHSPPSTFFQNHVDQLHHHRSASPTRVNVYNSSSLAQSFRFSIDLRSLSPKRSIAASKHNGPISAPKKNCMCSPTTHPGSFRCSLHKHTSSSGGHQQSASYPSNRLNMRRSAMKNSLVRIGSVEGEWVQRALTALIRPSSHHQKRRGWLLFLQSSIRF